MHVLATGAQHVGAGFAQTGAHGAGAGQAGQAIGAGVPKPLHVVALLMDGATEIAPKRAKAVSVFFIFFLLDK
jgi:hypothetical protein